MALDDSSQKSGQEIGRQRQHLNLGYGTGKLSYDNKLSKLLETVVKEVRFYAEGQLKHISRSAEIGLALSIENDINKILEMIVDEAREMSGADAGTLYILNKEKTHLCFRILQNDSMNVRIRGKEEEDGTALPNAPFTLPDVPLYKNGKENHVNVSSHAALTGEIINIPDVYDVPAVYEAKGFDFTGPRNYDKATGYRSQSMLVLPLKNHENEIIGVLQLLNAQDSETRKVMPFSPEYENLIASLASQAAVALTNTQLIKDLKDAVQTITDLFDAFIKSIATAIEKKSQTTGGHIKRVVAITMMIASKINSTDEGYFKNCRFTTDQMEEMRLSAWMHDVGKITTPEYVINKETKLQTIYDRINHVSTRFQLIAKTIENEYLKRKIIMLENWQSKSQIEAWNRTKKVMDQELEGKLQTLFDELEYIKCWNIPGEFMSQEHVDRIEKIAGKTFDDGKYPYLTDDETENLCIQKGNLTKQERKSIENHAKVTFDIINHLPFPEHLKNVPTYASQHHEKPDGSGYFQGLTKDDLPLQSRIIAIADIFEALTAPDRPYRKPMKLSEALRVLKYMREDNHIDSDIYDLFINSGLYLEYARRELAPDQLDE
ncbi:MAG: GAF domain-containing protein [Desulfobacterales bacterium]|nr:GAF domain-containing protein [Desulfobacterales bacterium]